MGIDNIKPPGGPGPFADPSAGASSAPGSGFAEARDKLQATGTGQPIPSTLAAASQFRRTALENPAEREAMVRACVSELIDSGQSVTGPLSDTQKEFLVDFLSADPLLRSQIETYLEKVLV
jgi:hypothetical protein